MTITIVILLFVPLCLCAKLPRELTKCKRSDPNFTNCLIKNANEGINLLTKDNPRLHLKSLDSIKFDEKINNVPASPWLNVTMEHLIALGLETTVITDIKFTDKQLIINSKLPQYGSVSEYTMNGQVLKLDIYGHGVMEFNYSNADIQYNADLSIVDKNGKKYYSIQKHNLVMHKIDHADITLSNLFDGDEAKGQAANKFIKDNSLAVFNEINYAVFLVIDTIYTMYISAFFNLIPINQLIDE